MNFSDQVGKLRRPCLAYTATLSVFPFWIYCPIYLRELSNLESVLMSRTGAWVTGASEACYFLIFTGFPFFSLGVCWMVLRPSLPVDEGSTLPEAYLLEPVP